MDKDMCPVCEKNGLSPWAWLYAGWPFYTTCNECGAKLRAKAKLIFEFIAQPLGFVLIMVGLLKSISGSVWWAIAGLVLGFLVYLLPFYFGKFVEVRHR